MSEVAQGSADVDPVKADQDRRRAALLAQDPRGQINGNARARSNGGYGSVKPRNGTTLPFRPVKKSKKVTQRKAEKATGRGTKGRKRGRKKSGKKKPAERVVCTRAGCLGKDGKGKEISKKALPEHLAIYHPTTKEKLICGMPGKGGRSCPKTFPKNSYGTRLMGKHRQEGFHFANHPCPVAACRRNITSRKRAVRHLKGDCGKLAELKGVKVVLKAVEATSKEGNEQVEPMLGLEGIDPKVVKAVMAFYGDKMKSELSAPPIAALPGVAMPPVSAHSETPLNTTIDSQATECDLSVRK